MAHWRTRTAPPQAPAALRGWLTDRDSLTARIRRRCTHFRVLPLAQRPARPLPDEAHVLCIPLGRTAWLREVLLIADGQPVVYARSWHPLTAPRHRQTAFFHSGIRPLGQLLFAHPRTRRSPLTLTTLTPRDARYHRALAAAGISHDARPAHLWARRSLFFRPGAVPILVSETFLPALACLAP